MLVKQALVAKQLALQENIMNMEQALESEQAAAAQLRRTALDCGGKDSRISELESSLAEERHVRQALAKGIANYFGASFAGFEDGNSKHVASPRSFGRVPLRPTQRP